MAALNPRLLPLWFVAVAFGGFGCAHASRAEAESAASSWTAQHPDGLTVEADVMTPTGGFEPAQESGACVNDLFRLRAKAGAAVVDLFFNCPQGEVADLAWLRTNLQSYNLALPLVIEADGWTFQALPPGSSLQSGLTFDAWADGRVELHIETPLFAVVGESHAGGCKGSSKVVDGGNPECLVNVPYEGPVVVYMSVPLSSSVFRAWMMPARK